ncbi:anoctamin-4-like, partial [Asbolus verrucosus]
DIPKARPPRIIIPESSLESQDGEVIANHNESSHNYPECKRDSLTCPQPTIFFNDGMRSVDFILVWDAFAEHSVTEAAFKKRKIFEANLISDGVELEYLPQEINGLNFIKIHAPHEVLRRYSEILKLRMPMREELCKIPRQFRQNHLYNAFIRQLPAMDQIQSKTNSIMNGITNQWDKLKSIIIVDTKKFPEKGQRFTAIYSRDKEYLFDVDSPCFFTPAIHSRVVQFILDRQRFSDNDKDDFAFGIERLLNDGIYTAAYPLHDGDLKQPGSMRYLLYNEWTALSKWYRYQPLDYVKEYFGVKIALYFAWLGFYTHMLLPAAVVGFLCFVYSLVTLYSNKPSEDICNANFTTKMCPLCNHWCDYWDLKETCTHSRITYLFDNATTVFFAIFMSFWAALFLELWKRYSAEITHRWDLTGFDIQEEHPRPHYLARLAHIKRVKKSRNVVTDNTEPQVPFWRLRVPITIFSFSIVMLLITLALATVVAIVVYRMSVLFSLRVYADKVDNSSAILFTTCTAACINLLCIVVFNWVYNYVAEYLTEFELLRTQSEFDDSLTLKIYLLQFVNYYASIFYIAFFKGKFVGSPKKYRKLFGFRQEECGPGGCLVELCIQLAIIMVGKQAMNTVLEMLFPLFYKWLNTVKVKTGLSKDQYLCKSSKAQWFKDFKLVEWGPRSLFPEYLEMVLQYGFVTIFVAAFPLAPFFALLNNILEMRLDARKLITFYRRPVSQRVRDIGVWYRILDSIGKLSIGFIIAFTSDFIPRLVYRVYYSGDHSLTGYLNFSLSYFNTSHFEIESAPRNYTSQEICRYPDFREAPWFSNRYEKTLIYWHILAARLAFVVVFENIVVFIIIILKWCIPDMPGKLRDRIRREAYLTNEIIIKQETIRAQNGHLYSSPTSRKELLRNIKECPATPEQWDRLLSKSLCGTDFDLMVHSGTYPPDEVSNKGDTNQTTPTSI